MITSYLFHRNAASPAIQSGRPCSILEEFQRQGVGIVPAYPLATREPFGNIARKIAYRAVGRRYRSDRDPERLQGFADEFTRLTKGRDFDTVFSPGSECVSYLETDKPITFCADATFAGMVDYYWDFQNLSLNYIAQGHNQEQQALDRAALAVYPSDWAAQTAREHYGVSPKKLAVIPFGANFGKTNCRGEIHAAIEQRNLQAPRILFVGKHWERKGGDILMEAARLLVGRGLKVHVDLVGCQVPAKYRHVAHFTEHGELNPSREEERRKLHALFSNAHLLCVPSRAEAFGMVYCEAAAFGLPAIGTYTGGISTIIKEGTSGYCLPLEADPAAYAQKIESILSSRARYEDFATNSFREFETRLNWTAFCREFITRMSALLPAASEPLLTAA